MYRILFLLFFVILIFPSANGEDILSDAPFWTAVRITIQVTGYMYGVFYVVMQRNDVNRLGNYKLYLIFCAFVALSLLISEFPVAVLAFEFHSFFILLFLMAVNGKYNENSRFIYEDLGNFTFLVSFVSVGVVYFAPKFGIYNGDTSRSLFSETSLDGRWVGITPHPNALGVLAAIGIVSHLILVTETRRSLAGIAFPVLVCLIALVGSGSRTALLATVASSFIYIAARYLFGFFIGGGTAFLLKLAASILFSIIIIVIVLTADLSDTFSSLIGRSSDFSGRTGLWNLALELLQQRPIFGWSFDSYATLKSYYGDTFQFNQFHNGFIDAAVRGGIFGEGILLAFILDYIFRLKALLDIDGKYAHSFFVIVFVVIYNLAEATVFRYDSPVWLLLLAVWFSLIAQLASRNGANSGPQPAIIRLDRRDAVAKAILGKRRR